MPPGQEAARTFGWPPRVLQPFLTNRAKAVGRLSLPPPVDTIVLAAALFPEFPAELRPGPGTLHPLLQDAGRPGRRLLVVWKSASVFCGVGVLTDVECKAAYRHLHLETS